MQSGVAIRLDARSSKYLFPYFNVFLAILMAGGFSATSFFVLAQGSFKNIENFFAEAKRIEQCGETSCEKEEWEQFRAASEYLFIGCSLLSFSILSLVTAGFVKAARAPYSYRQTSNYHIFKFTALLSPIALLPSLFMAIFAKIDEVKLYDLAQDPSLVTDTTVDNAALTKNLAGGFSAVYFGIMLFAAAALVVYMGRVLALICCISPSPNHERINEESSNNRENDTPTSFSSKLSYCFKWSRVHPTSEVNERTQLLPEQTEERARPEV